MRCLFKHARFLKRLYSGELKEARGRPKDPIPENKQPPGTKSYEVYYLDSRTNQRLARIHEYVLPSGKRRIGSWPDPKMLIIGSRKYHKLEAAKFVQDPAELFVFVRLKKCYGRFRKAQCFKYGPDRDNRVGRYSTPFLILILWLPLYVPSKIVGRFWPTR